MPDVIFFFPDGMQNEYVSRERNEETVRIRAWGSRNFPVLFLFEFANLYVGYMIATVCCCSLKETEKETEKKKQREREELERGFIFSFSAVTCLFTYVQDACSREHIVSFVFGSTANRKYARLFRARGYRTHKHIQTHSYAHAHTHVNTSRSSIATSWQGSIMDAILYSEKALKRTEKGNHMKERGRKQDQYKG